MCRGFERCRVRVLGCPRKEPRSKKTSGFEAMPSMGRADNALLVFRWHFRVVPMALYPPKGLSERVVLAIAKIAMKDSRDRRVIPLS